MSMSIWIRAKQSLRTAVAATAVISMNTVPYAALAQSTASPTTTLIAPKATTPIQHVIVIIGENRTFDHVFATYQPQQGPNGEELALRRHRQCRWHAGSLLPKTPLRISPKRPRLTRMRRR